MQLPRSARVHGSKRTGCSVSATSATDEQLMVRLAGGDRQALETLMDRFQQDIFRFCVHYLKETEKAKDLKLRRFRFDTWRAESDNGRLNFNLKKTL